MRTLWKRLRPQREPTPFDTEEPITDSNTINLEQLEAKDRAKGTGVNTQPWSNSTQNNDSNDEAVHKDAQPGVQRMEATTQVWSQKHLKAAYVMIWIIAFLDSLEQGMGFPLATYVSSSFKVHSFTPATGMVAQLIGGLSKLPLAKLIDIWGRPQGYMISVGFYTLGLIMMAACNSIELYVTSQVFYWIGQNGTDYVVSVFVADTSHLKNRGLMIAFMSTPFIITSWLSGPLATAFLGIKSIDGVPAITGPGWRWAYGTFAIIAPLVALPFFILLQWNYKKALKAGLVPARESDRTLVQSIKYYLIQFDAFGLLLIISGCALVLLPLDLYTYQLGSFDSPMIICMLVLGIILLMAFACWERFGAPVTFIPYHLLKDRTVLGANLLSAVIFFGFYMWNGMFFSFLQVVFGLTLTEASYIGNVYNVGSCLFSLAAGAIVARTGRFKGQALYFGIPITILGSGLMIKFRQPGVDIGYIVMCQIFIAFAGGTLVITKQIAAMSATSHHYIAVVLAIQSMFASVGGAIGATVSTAIWNGTFKDNLRRFLPTSEVANVELIFGAIEEQLAYPIGSPARMAIQAAYGDTQKWQLIATVAFLSLMVPCVLVWRNSNLKQHRQVKGTVF